MSAARDIKCFVLVGGGILLVGPDGRTANAYSPQIADGASASMVREHFEYMIESLNHAVAELSQPAIDLAKESTPAPVGSGG